MAPKRRRASFLLLLLPILLLLSVIEVESIAPSVYASSKSTTVSSLSPLASDVNNDGIVNMVDISIAALACFSRQGDSRWNPIADVNGDNYIDLLDVAQIAQDFMKKLLKYHFDEPLDWTAVSGTWSTANGLLEGISDAEGLVYTGDISRDFTLNARVKIAADSLVREIAFLVCFADLENYYWIGLGCWGHRVSISRRLNNVAQELAYRGSVEEVAKDVWYNISIEASANRISLYVNGQFELEATDSGLDGGGIGVRAWNSHVLIDYVVCIYGGTPSQGTTSGGDGLFVVKGANVALNCLHPASRNYQANAWAIMHDLGINCIKLSGGMEGDIWHFNPDNYPNEWATNLKNLFDNARSEGIRLNFAVMGDSWGMEFGIECPNHRLGRPGTPIDQAKAKIDMLAGNNYLHYDFLTDPVVLAWSTSNEQSFGYTDVYDWNIALLDYIRSKGAKAFVQCPAYPYWVKGDEIFSATTEPILRGHVDYLELHYYDLSAVKNAIDTNGSVYTAVYNDFVRALRKEIDGRGTIPLDHLILGEFGLPLGAVVGAGVRFSCTDENRRDYYRAVYDAIRDTGFVNVFQFDLFHQVQASVNDYAIVSSTGQYYSYCADIVRSAYG